MVQGELHHESGLVVRLAEGGWEAYPDSIDDFREHELARGLSADQVDARLSRLMHEAKMWRLHQ